MTSEQRSACWCRAEEDVNVEKTVNVEARYILVGCGGLLGGYWSGQAGGRGRGLEREREKKKIGSGSCCKCNSSSNSSSSVFSSVQLFFCFCISFFIYLSISLLLSVCFALSARIVSF